MAKRRSVPRQTRTILLYAAGLAGLVFLLEWLQYRYFARAFSTELYMLILAVGFAALGIWIGRMLTPTRQAEVFQRNDAAIISLGLTEREMDMLDALAAGQTNRQIADAHAISPNTVKTHVARIYEKLEVSQRVQAVQKARSLRLIP